MKIIRNNILTALLLMFGACNAQLFDENYAALVVKKNISVSGTISAKKLKGGYSGANLFLVSTKAKKYVVRCTNNSQENNDIEIYNATVASNVGYGPRIYFSDPSHGIVIMEYLHGEKTTATDFAHYAIETTSNHFLQSDQFYIKLAHLMQKIHQGPAFKDSGYDVFKSIDVFLKAYKSKYSPYVSVTGLETIMSTIYQTLSPKLITNVPCHNDLHRANIMITKSRIKVIDFGQAHQGDPFFDIAMVSVAFYIKPIHEKLLLTTYLGRQPNTVEMAKLYLMKQIFLIFFLLHGLAFLPDESLGQYNLTTEYSMSDIAKKTVDGTINSSKTEDRLKVVKAQAKQIFDNFKSQEFKDAVEQLF
jgi:thiamine kinase-like enzyme